MAIKTMPNLRHLSLRDGSLENGAVVALGHAIAAVCPPLVHLDLSGNELGADPEDEGEVSVL